MLLAIAYEKSVVANQFSIAFIAFAFIITEKAYI